MLLHCLGVGQVNALRAAVGGGPARRSAPLEADERGRILGEAPLPATAKPVASASRPAAPVPSAAAPPGVALQPNIGPAGERFRPLVTHEQPLHIGHLQCDASLTPVVLQHSMCQYV